VTGEYMATFEDPIQEELELKEVEEEQETEEEQVEESEVEEPPEPELPSKYKGKSLDDIIKMHQEAEKLIGKQAQEVGEVRKLADELIKRELSQKKAVENPKEEVDFAQRLYEDPEKAISDAVSKHPAITQAQQQALVYKQQQVMQQLRSEYSNFDEIIQDPSFFEWIKASPVRTKLYAEADGNYDYNSASELLSTWNLIKGTKHQKTEDPVVTQAKKETAKNLKVATVDTGSPAPSSKKTYRRSDLINLRLRDPDRYYAMQDEIMDAYATGRVK